MSTLVLATKLFAPTRRLHLVARPRLIALLDATIEAGQRLTLVAAPAGFGKTTLVADWLAEVQQRRADTRVAWLSLDDGDNQRARLLTHLVAALRSVDIEVHERVLEPPDTAGVLTAIVNDVSRAGERAPEQRWVLVLDDYHVIRAPEVHEAVTFLLDHLPHRLHLVMATRSDPPLPLARLRSRGQLVEVRATELRFTPREAQEFLNLVMGLDLSVGDVQALEERTEGWVAGLQLAALSLRSIEERAEIADFIDAFTGSNRFVLDYLADEVLARQSAEVSDFLLRTAVLDRLTGSLCDAVTGRADSAQLLEILDRSDLFVVPLDRQRSWYRYHHLFADVLQARLLAAQPDEVPALHQRASGWYAEHHHVPEAVRHALAAEDFQRAAYLMEEALPEVRRARQDRLLLDWMQSLPAPVVRSSPVLSIVSGWSSLVTGDLEGLQSRLDDAEAALGAGAADPTLAAAWADTEDLHTAPATISVYRASLAQARGDVAGTVRHARRALELARPVDHFVRGAAAGFLGMAAWATGDIHEALATFSQAASSLHAAGNLVDELDGTVVLADLWVASGRPGGARRLLEQAVRAATEGGEPYPRATADLHVGLAELDRERGEVASAEAHLEAARVLRERGSITENRHRWFVAMSQLRATAGDPEMAGDLLDTAEELYRHGFYPDVRPIAAMKARLRIAADDLAAADAWARDRALGVDDDHDYLREYEHLTFVRLLLAHARAEPPRDSAGGASPAAAALNFLDRLHDAAAHAERDGSLLEIRVLQALAHHALGEASNAVTALSRALVETPEPDSYVRLFLDEGEPMLALLREAIGSAGAASGNVAAAAQEHVRRILQRAEGPTVITDPPQSPVGALSQRELQVLRLLDSDLTGPQIARQLYVTVNTLRTHTKRIFTKLDVTTRQAAVRRARERGLL